MTAHIFREYDIRGVADRDLTDTTVYSIGRGLAKMLAVKGRAARLVLARDCRLSGPRLFEAVLAGLVDGGVDVLDTGVGPTPLMYYAVHHLDADGGIMITGSHNPSEENGFKIMRGKSSFFGEDLQTLRQLVLEGSDSEAARRGSIQSIPVEDDYVNELRDSMTIEDPSLRFVVDAGNGAAGPLGLRVLRALGLDPVPLFCEMDGSFPNHHPDPTVLANLQTLVTTVQEEQAVAGIAWDGDGDRLGVVDAKGDVVYGDRLLALFARDLLRHHPGAIVLGEVKCSQTVFDDIQKHGGQPLMWKTGHSLIKAKMKEEGALLAGEMSGHFFFADRYYGYDDGICAAARLIEILARERQTIPELLAGLPHRCSTPEIRLECPDDRKFQIVDAVRERLRDQGVVSDVDGARITYEDGAWGLVRASNTGPVIVLRFEAPTEARLAEIRREMEAAIGEARSGA